MANKLKFELNRAGVAELLKSGEMQSALKKYGLQVQSNAMSGEGSHNNYGLTIGNGTVRAHANIYVEDKETYYSNLKHNTLIKALGSAK